MDEKEDLYLNSQVRRQVRPSRTTARPIRWREEDLAFEREQRHRQRHQRAFLTDLIMTILSVLMIITVAANHEDRNAFSSINEIRPSTTLKFVARLI